MPPTPSPQRPCSQLQRLAIVVTLSLILPSSSTSSSGASIPRCYRHVPDASSCLLCGSDDAIGSPRCVHHQHYHRRTYLCHYLHEPLNGDSWLSVVEKTTAKDLITAMSGPYGDMPECPIVGQGRIIESPHCPASESPPEADANGLFSGVDCSRTCCRMADFTKGSFSSGATGAGDDWPLAHLWETASGCTPLSLRPSTALPCMRAAGVTRLILMGDSVMRQLHNRFVSLTRKRRTTVDRHTWGDARYRLWADRDLFEVGGEPGGTAEHLHPEEQLQQFKELLQPNTSSRIRLGVGRQGFEQRLNHPPLEEPLLEVLFIWCNILETQASYLTALHDLSRELGAGFAKSSLFMGVWQYYRDTNHLLKPAQQGSFDKVLGLLAQPSAGLHHTYILNGHTGFMRDTLDVSSPSYHWIAQTEELNAYLAAWSRGVPHAVLLDFDALSRASPFRPPNTHPGDLHFQCEILALDAVPACISVNTQGGCVDSMNTVVVQLILNHMCIPHMQFKFRA